MERKSQSPAEQRRRRVERHANGRTSRSEYHRFRRYRITEEEYDALVLARDGRCDICRRIRELCVDHDHVSGQFRGLLCHKCNTSLALLENEKFVQHAHAYLQLTGGKLPDKERTKSLIVEDAAPVVEWLNSVGNCV